MGEGENLGLRTKRNVSSIKMPKTMNYLGYPLHSSRETNDTRIFLVVGIGIELMEMIHEINLSLNP